MSAAIRTPFSAAIGGAAAYHPPSTSNSIGIVTNEAGGAFPRGSVFSRPTEESMTPTGGITPSIFSGGNASGSVIAHNPVRKELWATNVLQSAFLDWLLLPETAAQLDAILSAVLQGTTAESAAHTSGPPGCSPTSETSGALPYDPCPSPRQKPPAASQPPALRPMTSGPLDQPRDEQPLKSLPSTIRAVEPASAESEEPEKDGIPRFWYPSRVRLRAPPAEAVWNAQVEMHLLSIFNPSGRLAPSTDDLKIDFPTFESLIVKETLKLSKYFSCCLYCLINGLSVEDKLLAVCESVINNEPLYICYPKLVMFWQTRGLTLTNEVANFFNIVREDDEDVIFNHNFVPFLNELLDRHPGVEFLKPTPEFQKRYADTVAARILYDLEAVCEHRISYQQLAKSCLPECWRLTDDELDINSIREFFSYEHFYVAYCRFWALDCDHDFRLDKQDLVKYDNHAFSHLTLNRLMGESELMISDGHTVGYEGFCYLIMHDEDKTTNQSIEFWFRIMDLDGDGVLREQELLQFYSEQLVRLESRTMEAPPFEVILCQLNDMIKPDIPDQFTLRDIKRNRRHAPLFFNTLLSLTKFWAWEHRDPFTQRTELIELPFFTDWDRFCHLEYERLSTEDMSEDMGWDEFSGYGGQDGQSYTRLTDDHMSPTAASW